MLLNERKIGIIMYCFDYHCIIVVFAHAQCAQDEHVTRLVLLTDKWNNKALLSGIIFFIFLNGC